MRIDRWLWAARFYKTRGAATEAVLGGRVHVNDERVKPAKDVRPGDRLRTWQVLRSVSPPKRTKLGLGRFWVIDVEYVNQHGKSVGTESYTGFGYRRDV